MTFWRSSRGLLLAVLAASVLAVLPETLWAAEAKAGVVVGTAATSFDYWEHYRDRRVSGTHLTGKASALVPLVARKFIFTVGGHGTLASLRHASPEVPGPRFYGVDTRLGFHAPGTRVSDNDFGIQLGWYFWSMTVDAGGVKANQYGIEAMNGPQAYAVFTHHPRNARGFWIYAKYASMMVESFRFAGAQNREVAGGFGLHLTRSKTPLSLTFDAARIKFNADGNAMRLLTGCVGLQKAF